MDGLLSAEDEALIRAEQRGADFGVLVEVGTGRVPADELERALGVVLAHWPSLAARVVRRGTAVTVRHDPPARVTDLAHLADLRGLTVLASRGDRLLRYRVDTQRRVLQLLGHHLVLDADSLDAFLADLDAVLAGRPLHGSGEWPWQPAPVPASPAVGRQARALPQGPLGGPGVEPTLVASRVPAPEEHAVRTLDAALADRVTAASRTCGVTPFGIYWAAAARIARADSARADTTPAHPTGSAAAQGAAALSTVVSSRLLSRTPQRCGNATTHLTVALGPAAAGRAGVRADFTDFTATWRGQRAAATVTAAPLLVSLSVAPTGCDLEVLGPVRLGPYVVKYEQHVQLQVVGDAVVVEAHDSRGLPWTGVADDASAGERLLDAFVTALSAVVDQCLERPDGPAAPATPRTKRTMPATPVSSPRQAAAAVPSAAPDVATSALGRLLAAEPRLLVRDVGITSFDVLSVLDDLAVQHGVRVGVDTFYTWETAGDVQAVVAGPAPAVVEPAARPAADVTRVVLPHLSDVFIDAYRQGSADPYAVELAFVIDPALAVSVAHLARHTRECLARHEVWRSRAGFSREGVVLDLDGPVTPVREVDAAAWKQVRDPRPLSVRPPARLADVAVARVGGELGVYVNVHHLLLDHVGLELLLADLLAGLRGETTAPATTWGQVLEPLHRARADAAELWATDPVPSTLRPVGPSGGVTGGYVQHRLPWGVR
ncbi:MAG: Phosphopantetheine attachment site, partial [Humibacillus sp.]|nr:Phosphopantetheine attachment site [Humibacillus sp.]